MTCRTTGSRPLPYAIPRDFAATRRPRRHWNPLHGKHVVIRGDIIGEAICCTLVFVVLGIDWTALLESLL